MSKQSKKQNTLVTIVKYLLVVLLLLGAVGLIIRFAGCGETITGMYVKYGDITITSDNDGIVIEHDDTNTAAFTICNNDGWGIYDVSSCTVKIVNNVSSSSEHDFEYIVDGANLPSTFSDITDFTSYFTSSGNSITVNSDGDFEITFNYYSMSGLLNACYGKTVTLDSEIYFNTYSYFAIQIISPDESETLTIPFTYNYIPVEWIELSDSTIYL